MFKVGDNVKYNIGSKDNPNYIKTTVKEIYLNGHVRTNNGHTFNSERLHYGSCTQMMNKDRERVKLELL